MDPVELIQADLESMHTNVEYLVIGSGIAGLTLALKLAEQGSVLLVSKGSLVDNNSAYAQGGLASVLGVDDTFEQHVADTLEAGAGLCHRDIVETVIRSGPTAVAELQALGVPFDRSDEAYDLTREGGHSRHRVTHHRDQTGRAILDVLIEKALGHPNIKIWDHHFAIDLITSDKVAPDFRRNRCLGAYVLASKTGEIATVRAADTFICTGGHGMLYLYTSNPHSATGDGLAMGWRAGCRVANLEFMQFHPTCLFHPRARNFLISEALRGEGGILRNAEGVAFVDAEHPLGSLAPRDIVARAIDRELKRSGANHVYLDIRPMGEAVIRERFPHIHATCREFGIDIAKEMIPVVPAAHYSCGGLVTDEWGQTNVGNLYAVGEVACSGLHGANRLASNSLLEACVFADRAAQHARLHPKDPDLGIPLPPWNRGRAIPHDEKVLLSHAWDEIRRLMWHYVGIVRSEHRLKKALGRITVIKHEVDTLYWDYEVCPEVLEVRNLAHVARLTIRCAMARRESRGIHFTTDHPQTMDDARDTII